MARPAYRLHLGAHKTATTYLQTRLEMSADVLSAFGVRVVLPEEMRSFTGLAFAKNRQTSLRQQLAAWKGRSALSAELAEIERSAPPTILISEENIIGNSRQILRTGKLYHQARQRLRTLPKHLNSERTEIFIAIRSYANFFASCHAQVIRSGRFKTWDEYDADRLAALPRHWQDLVADIRAILPRATLTIWRFEDLDQVGDRVLSMMTGMTPNWIKGRDERPMQSLSAEGMARLVDLAQQREVMPADIAKIMAETNSRDGYSRYDPWSSAEREALDTAYEADWRALRLRSDLNVIRP